MNFTSIKELTIPEGKVIKIARRSDGMIFWQKVLNVLPDEYQRTEYIVNSTSTNGSTRAYIDLGFAFDSGCTYIIKYEPNNVTSDYIFGAAENSGKLRCMITDSGSAMVYGSNSSNYVPFTIPDPTDYGVRHIKVEMAKGFMRVTNLLTENTKQGDTQIEYTMTNNLYLFAQNYNGSVRYAAIYARCFGFTYYDKNGTLICDLVPCYRKSDGVIGMYDIVRKIFLTNAQSTGNFMKGPDVVKEYENWIPYSTEQDGITIYNGGLGYKDGYRVRSNGEEEERTSASCSGFIPFRKGEKLYIYPKFVNEDIDNAINFIDSSFTNVGQVTSAGSAYGICIGTGDTFMPKNEANMSVLDWTEPSITGVDDVAYVRVTNYIQNFVQSGVEMAVKVKRRQENLEDFQQVEWIQAAANVEAYIDLGFSYDTGATVYLGQWVMNDNTAYPFGAAENNGARRCMFTIPYNNGDGAFAYCSNATTYQAVGVTYTTNALNEFVATYKGSNFLFRNLSTGNEHSYNEMASYTMSSPLYLFAQNYNGSPRFGDIRRIAYFKYYDKTGTLICDLVPCYRKSNGVIGMYDTVRKIFLTNAGSGTFTKGPEVNGYKNWVRYATESDGVTIYNDGLGYKDGYRIRSGGELIEADGSSCTGFIPVKAGDVVRMAGYDFNHVSAQNTINAYAADFGHWGQAAINNAEGGYGQFSTVWKEYGWSSCFENPVGVLNWIAPPDVDNVKIAYIRVTGIVESGGSEMIITVNEEIK